MQDIPLGIVQETEICPCEQILYAQPVLENKTHKLIRDFEIQKDPLISARRLDLELIHKKKENSSNYGHHCPGWPQSKIERKRKEE